MTASQVLATAHPNIALVKYWGKRDTRLNTPAVSSLSITLDTLQVATRAQFGETDALTINGASEPRATARAIACLDAFRTETGVAPRPIVASSDVNFPVAAGLASSAAGFAALVVAADALYGGLLPSPELARLAGQASGSAARSLFGGFVHLAAPAHAADPIDVREVAPADAWPLEVVIAVTATGPKAIGSTDGMELTRQTAPFYSAWVDAQPADIEAALAAVLTKDFAKLADVAEHSCLKMHAVAMAAQPGLVYWNGATVAALHCVRALRQAGTPVFFTIDAGPQLKAICEPGSGDTVAAALSEIPGVIDVLRCGLGPGALAEAC
ncbi:MAG: diphosphomevalonate decarboxylase [Pseudomonadota bacterium]